MSFAETGAFHSLARSDPIWYCAGSSRCRRARRRRCRRDAARCEEQRRSADGRAGKRRAYTQRCEPCVRVHQREQAAAGRSTRSGASRRSRRPRVRPRHKSAPQPRDTALHGTAARSPQRAVGQTAATRFAQHAVPGSSHPRPGRKSATHRKSTNRLADHRGRERLEAVRIQEESVGDDGTASTARRGRPARADPARRATASAAPGSPGALEAHERARQMATTASEELRAAPLAPSPRNTTEVQHDMAARRAPGRQVTRS